MKKKSRKQIAIKKYKEGYKKIPESLEEIKALAKMSAEAFKSRERLQTMLGKLTLGFSAGQLEKMRQDG